MMRTVDYGLSAVSGAFVIVGADAYTAHHPWLAVFAAVGFVIAVWLVRLQPTNISDGLIVRVSARDVNTFINGRDVQWCGNKDLHNIHAWSDWDWFPVEKRTVCLGHECLCPESHMKGKTA